MLDPEKNNAPPLVLIANDQEWSARSLESILGPQGYAVVRAHTGRQAIDLAWRTRPDAIVVDSGMTDIGGVEVCRLLRRDARFAVSTPIIVTAAGTNARSERLEAFRAGAWEYCTDPIDADALLLKLDTFIASKRELDQCHDDSLLDRNTGLYNVRGLTRRAQELGADASRRHAPLACVAVSATPNADVDESDIHQLTHRIAEHLGDIFRRAARVSDVIGHLGRSEFGIIAPSTAADGAVRLVERIQEMVQSSPLASDGRDQSLQLRAGYCAVPNFAESSVDAVELLLRAATALRHVKGNETRGITAFEDVPLRFVH
jgi:diguanylate cyclase (GGDEF)-like protein